jgi:hypothetical protein
MHRFVWDLHYPPPAVLQFSYPIAAIYRNTIRMPLGTWVLPGQYSVKLMVNGKSFTQRLTVSMDPRIKTPAGALAQQFALSMQLFDGLRQDYEALLQVRALRAQLLKLREMAGKLPVADAITALDKKAASLEGGSGGRRGGAPAAGSDQSTLARLNGELGSVFGVLQESEEIPTSQAVAAANELPKTLAAVLARWNELKTKDVPALNDRLREANLPPITP